MTTSLASSCLKTRPIPPKAWLEQLEKDFGQIWHFWRPDGLSEQNLKIFANAISGPNILGQNFQILFEHIARIFGKFNMALSPIIGGPPPARVRVSAG